MSPGHRHSETVSASLRLRRWPKIVVLALIALSGLAAVIGVFHWWPDEDRIDSVHALIPFAVDGTKVVHGELLDVIPACTGTQTRCGDSRVRILDGANADKTVKISLTPDIMATQPHVGDRILLLDPTGIHDGMSQPFSYYRPDRGGSMLWLAIVFAIAVVLVAWRRGILALLSLAFAGLVVVGYLIPALLSGQPAVPVTLATSVLILIVMLYVTHGFSMRTSVALIGALVGVAMSTLFAWLAVTGARLGGLGDDAATLLSLNVHWVTVQQLIVASVILAGLGTLNDITVTQASALWELRAASPRTSHWELFRRAMRIGRDHVASTVYTLVFAYLGTALVLLVAIQLYGGTTYDFLTSEDVAEEIVRTLVGGLALVLAMPITTAIGALIVAGAAPEAASLPARRRRRRGAERIPHTDDAVERLPDPWAAD